MLRKLYTAANALTNPSPAVTFVRYSAHKHLGSALIGKRLHPSAPYSSAD